MMENMFILRLMTLFYKTETDIFIKYNYVNIKIGSKQ